MGKPDVTSDAVDEATSTMLVLSDTMRERIAELKNIWRRQRMDVDTQIRYYANGLLEDYYRVRYFFICHARCWKHGHLSLEIPQGGIRHRFGGCGR
jgi:hypothetical protein